MSDRRPSLDELIHHAATAPDRPTRVRALVRLARAASGPATVRAFQGLVGVGPQLALEFVARLPDGVPLDLVAVAVPHLAADLSVALRLAAAGKLLSTVPDEPKAVAALVVWVLTRNSLPTGAPAGLNR